MFFRRVPEVAPHELAERLRGEEKPLVVDVREPDETAVSKLPGALCIPMDQLPERLAELPKDRDIVVVCRSGARSGACTRYLIQSGFTRVKNLRGGMIGWSRAVDPKMPVA
ncbi:MAG: rhodanese-like domain-containing protein [Armatimonadetes bacterium]|jgi:rhodanese-related sulfurtransferase|nr:rhodanese-like domain-containing protein [Armatimonadota bacterium]MCA1995778.1 rhodanese-like domain-containing protein [Armatimonadota bacterium]